MGSISELSEQIAPSTGGPNTTSVLPIKSTNKPIMPYDSSLVFFAERFKNAFPGLRTPEWFSTEADLKRLSTLLKQPLSFANSQPMWWWRGPSNLHIYKFEYLGNRDYLMNVEELRIRKIAAAPGSTYKRNFVYVQTEAMEPTGLYNPSQSEYWEHAGYAYEEYGIFNRTQVVKRSEYDDGAAMIDGALMEPHESELRLRYISPYNFLIAPQQSPINNPKFDYVLEPIMRKALTNDAEIVLAELISRVNELPLRED